MRTDLIPACNKTPGRLPPNRAVRNSKTAAVCSSSSDRSESGISSPFDLRSIKTLVSQVHERKKKHGCLHAVQKCMQTCAPNRDKTQVFIVLSYWSEAGEPFTIKAGTNQACKSMKHSFKVLVGASLNSVSVRPYDLTCIMAEMSPCTA